jgi:hypothetical protein
MQQPPARQTPTSSASAVCLLPPVAGHDAALALGSYVPIVLQKYFEHFGEKF